MWGRAKLATRGPKCIDMPNLNRIQTKKKYETLSHYDFEGSIKELIIKLGKYNPEYVIKVERDYDEDIVLVVYELREETDREYEIRIQKEQAQESSQEAYARKQYEDLKKRFGND